MNCYFQSKSETVPLQCQVRTMVNGYPSTTILPFGTASAEPEDVQISEDASLLSLIHTDAADDLLLVDLGGRCIIKKKTRH